MAITNRTSIHTRLAQGKGMIGVYNNLAGTSLTAAAQGSGNVTITISPITGSSHPSTYYGWVLPAGLSTNLNMIANFISTNSADRSGWLAHLYKLGTLDMTIAAPTDGFTAEAGVTFPVLRTKFGTASQPVTLLPIINIVTATATAACVFTPKTTAGGAGYTDQDGNSTVGAKTWTAPGAVTAQNGSYFIRLNDGDLGLRTLTQLSVSTASTTGTAQVVWGAEIIGMMSQGTFVGLDDAVTCGIRAADLAPAVATSGTVTSILVWLGVGAVGTTAPFHAVVGALNS